MINVLFTGDILPSNTLNTLSIGVASRLNNEKYLFMIDSKLVKLFNSVDFSISNLEAPILREDYSKSYFSGNPRIINLMKKLNIRIVSISNNHILEKGINGFNNTKKTLNQNSIKYLGTLSDGHSRIIIEDRGGIRIAFASFNDIHDIFLKGSYSRLDKKLLVATLDKINELDADFIVFIFHWGNEYINLPSLHQREIARNLIDQGVDVIIGHHPHVIQPVEAYRNGLICYSLGNFIFDQVWWKNTKQGLTVKLMFDKNNLGKKINFKCYPINIGKNYLPILGTEKEGKLLNDNLIKKMNYLLDKGEDSYICHYNKYVRKNRTISRLLRKKQFLLNFIKMNNNARRSIFYYYFKKI